MTEPYADLGGRPSTAALPDVRRGCGQRVCNHPDSHECPWLNELHDGHAVPCSCSHRVEKGGKNT